MQLAGFQTWIGQVDVKSSPVYFYVQRNTNFSSGGPIPFQVERLNIGNAMNLSSGKFTAPRAGIYSFSFTGWVYFPPSSSRLSLYVGMYFNDNLIGRGEADEVGTVSQYDTVSLQSTLNLQAGDEIWVQISLMSIRTYLHDDGYHYTHFTGWLLEENQENIFQ